MKHVTKFLLCLLIGTWAYAGWACHQIVNLQNVTNLNNNPNPVISFTVRRIQTNVRCDYVIGITKGDNNDGSYNRRLQRNQIYIPVQTLHPDTGEVLKTLPDVAPPSNMIVGSFPQPGVPWNNQDLTFQVELGPVPYGLPNGLYQNTWRLQLFTRPHNSNQAYSLANDRDFRLQYTLASSLDLSLVPTGAPFDMLATTRTVNFGSLQQNDVRSFDMIIGNNTAYSFTLSSTHNGRLVRVGSGGGPNDRVDYEFSIGGTAYTSPIVLNAGQFPYTSSVINPPASSQVRYPIDIRITGDPASKNQGHYQDTIVIELSAN